MSSLRRFLFLGGVAFAGAQDAEEIAAEDVSRSDLSTYLVYDCFFVFPIQYHVLPRLNPLFSLRK